MPIECKTKSILPPRISCDWVNKFFNSSMFVASAGIILEPVFSASLLVNKDKENTIGKTHNFDFAFQKKRSKTYNNNRTKLHISTFQ